MKKLILIVLSVLMIVVPGNGQTGFKQPHKKPAGTVRHNLNPQSVYSHSTLQSQSVKTPVKKSLSFANARTEPLVIRKDKSPVYLERKTTSVEQASTVSMEDRLYRFLESYRNVTEIDNPRGVIRVQKMHTDELGITHIRTVQEYKGVEIYGTESVYHYGKGKERLNGSFFKINEDIVTVPTVQYAQVVNIVKSDLEKITVFRELSDKEKKFMNYYAPECAQIIFPKDDGTPVLAWMVHIRPNFIEEWQYVIDANDGTILRKFNNTKSDGPVTGTGTDLNNIPREIKVYEESGYYYLYNISEPMYNQGTDEGIIITLDANNTSTTDLDYSMISCDDNLWTGHSAAVSAHHNAAITYEYFRSKFGRNSLNDQGGNIISFVNVTEDGKTSMQNAFWNGQAVFYGNGGSHFKSLAGALDVTAHELGHGVVSNTANLEYIGQSGAMNESFADIFGSMIDRDDWLIGEDVVKAAYYPSGALRNMSDPHNGGTSEHSYWQPAHLSEMYLGSQDNGGVHINSGIGNKAFYLFATAVTKDKAEKVYYRTLKEYLTKTSQFIDLRIAVVQSAKDIYGQNSAEAIKAGEAFDAVGIYPDTPQTDDPDTYDTNPGAERLLIYNTDDSYSYTLYRSPLSGNVYQGISETAMKGKVSVTDDGSAGVFVDLDDRINVLILDPNNPSEDLLSDEAFFDNVAVSKDGNRVAAISVEVDTSIFVYDFGLKKWARFTLYNPTTSDVEAGGVLYADAIEFDHTGEYIMYDAYNELNSDTYDDLSYWDVGFIKVWDNEAGDFADGSIFKLFTQLPANVSVGNPVFSKNSSDIIAFDYFYDDGMEQEYGIFGANLETGELNLITENTTLGYPSFGKNDDKIAFGVMDIPTSSGYYNGICSIALAEDKISPAGSITPIISDAQWPVYYATGQRDLSLAPVANFTADFKFGDAPLQVKFVDLSTNKPTSWQWTFQGGNPATSTLQNPEVIYSGAGIYKVTLKVSNAAGENTLVRESYINTTGTPASADIENALVYYPNPVDNILNISYKGDFTIRIFSQSGSLMLSDSNKSQIDLSALNSGMYILEIKTGSGVFINKLVKR